MKGKSFSLSTLRFECTGCGGCCTGRGEHYIAVTRDEKQRIWRYLGISWRWFRRRYITVDGALESLRWEKNRCVFLDEGKRCRVYSVRPAQCRDYPFWPEVVESRESWYAERRRCEGIGRGSVIPLKEVKAKLRRQRD